MPTPSTYTTTFKAGSITPNGATSLKVSLERIQFALVQGTTREQLEQIVQEVLTSGFIESPTKRMCQQYERALEKAGATDITSTSVPLF